jgi:aldehyde:ferredoxin oxidoreductase
MDPISMGATLAAAMELYERGIVSEELTGMPLPFGSSEALVRMTEATGYREGFGDRLAEGSRRLGESLGHPEVFMGCKGQEFPAYDPRAFQGMGVAYATSNRGGCHLRAWTPGVETTTMDPFTPEGKGPWVAQEQNRTTAHDNTGICSFTGPTGGPTEDLVPCVAAATGVDFTYDEFLTIGERTWNLERWFNLQAGLTKDDDSLPTRLLSEPFQSGPSAGVTVQLEQMLQPYYEARGWTKDGVPTKEKLAELGLTL